MARLPLRLWCVQGAHPETRKNKDQTRFLLLLTFRQTIYILYISQTLKKEAPMQFERYNCSLLLFFILLQFIQL